MSTFTLPLNARLVTEGAATASGYTFPQTGYIPAVYAVSVGFADVQTLTSITSNVFVVPAGYTLNDVEFISSTLFTGTSVGTTEFKVGNGAIANQASLLTTMNAKTAYIGRADTNTQGVLGTKLAADTTITFTASCSGAAAATGYLTAGAGQLLLTIGVPYYLATRG